MHTLTPTMCYPDVVCRQSLKSQFSFVKTNAGFKAFALSPYLLQSGLDGIPCLHYRVRTAQDLVKPPPQYPQLCVMQQNQE